MKTATIWGYSVESAVELVPMLSATEFNVYTAGKYAGDSRIEANIKAACEAIRNYCGWHVYPETNCSIAERLVNGNGRIKRAGPDILIQIPAAFISSVSSVTVDGVEWQDYITEGGGLIRLMDIPSYKVNRKTLFSVEYVAGVPESNMDAIRELVAHRVQHALVSPAGVQSESAGGVSVTYAANWINSSRATALGDDSKEVLAPYRVKGVF